MSNKGYHDGAPVLCCCVLFQYMPYRHAATSDKDKKRPNNLTNERSEKVWRFRYGHYTVQGSPPATHTYKFCMFYVLLLKSNMNDPMSEYMTGSPLSISVSSMPVKNIAMTLKSVVGGVLNTLTTTSCIG